VKQLIIFLLSHHIAERFNMSSSLPGFLRRSLRSVDDPTSAPTGENSNDNDTVGSRASKSLIPTLDRNRLQKTKAKVKSEEEENDRHRQDETTGIDTPEEDSSVDLKFRLTKTSLAFDRSEQTVAEKKESVHNNESDVSFTTASLNEVTSNNTKDKGKSISQHTEHAAESKKSYKVLEFEKVIKMPVVDIETLRKLAWNGIPVSIGSFSTCNITGVFWNRF
jgi:hypothetical protein